MLFSEDRCSSIFSRRKIILRRSCKCSRKSLEDCQKWKKVGRPTKIGREKKLQMLQEELRGLSEMEESRKTDEDRKREDLLLQELVLVVNKRNELVMQRDEEEQMVRDMEQLDEEITLPENNHLRLNRRDECKMQ